jgi:hypothetical protein
MIYEKLEDGLKDMVVFLGVENKKKSVPKERANPGIYQVSEEVLKRGDDAASRLFTCSSRDFYRLLEMALLSGMRLKV